MRIVHLGLARDRFSARSRSSRTACTTYSSPPSPPAHVPERTDCAKQPEAPYLPRGWTASRRPPSQGHDGVRFPSVSARSRARLPPVGFQGAAEPVRDCSRRRGARPRCYGRRGAAAWKRPHLRCGRGREQGGAGLSPAERRGSHGRTRPTPAVTRGVDAALRRRKRVPVGGCVRTAGCDWFSCSVGVRWRFQPGVVNLDRVDGTTSPLNRMPRRSRRSAWSGSQHRPGGQRGPTLR